MNFLGKLPTLFLNRFSDDDMEDLTGKTVIVTGGNRGIGKELVRLFLKRNAKVYMASRNWDSALATIAELEKDTGREAIPLHLDLSSLRSCRRAAEMFLRTEVRLDILINGGGIMFLMETPGHLDLSDEGFDIQWGTNVVGPYYFTKLLLPALLAGAAYSPDGKARVVFTTGHFMTESIMLDTVTDTAQREWVSPRQRFGQSKLANVILAREFARRYGEKGLVSVSVNPGIAQTDIYRNLPLPIQTLFHFVSPHASKCALMVLWAATSEEGICLSGEHLNPWGSRDTTHSEAQSLVLGPRLWSWLYDNVMCIP